MIIFSEDKYALELLANGFKRFMSHKDLAILAKYYARETNNKDVIAEKLIEFCKKYNSEYNEVKFYKRIKAAVAVSNTHHLRVAMPVKISQIELNFVKGVTDFDMQKILFCMLVIAKYAKENPTRKNPKINEKYADKYYVNMSFNDILKLAKVYGLKAEKNRILHAMQTLGYIRATLNGSFEVCFVDQNCDEVGVVVEDVDNILEYLPFYCDDCGKMIRRSKKNSRCSDCYKKHLRELKRDWARG